MEVKTIAVIALAEACVVALLVIVALCIYVQKLKALLNNAQKGGDDAEDGEAPISEQATGSERSPEPNDRVPPVSPQKTYTAYLDDELAALRQYHEGIAEGGDIALDIDPGTPLERRIAAVRNAVLIAEREATLAGDADWVSLKGRYKALLSYYEDYPSPKAEAKIHELSEALRSAQKHVASIEKYKGLYFDLEASWHASKNQANDYYEQIKGHVAEQGEGGDENLLQLVGDYHKSYDGIDIIFDSQTPLPETIEAATEELHALRRTTAEQHRLIDQLRQKISGATDDNAKVALIRSLEDELNRQQRFLRESESCVTLMENELSVTHKELKSLKAKLKELPSLREHLKDLRDEAGVSEVRMNRLKDEVRHLKTELERFGAERSQGAAGDARLREELALVKKQYAELEERYLDLKLSG
ncbi:MAG TPA: hypothetical protein VIC26_03290 [Marinagarivorans sp.]